MVGACIAVVASSSSSVMVRATVWGWRGACLYRGGRLLLLEVLLVAIVVDGVEERAVLAVGRYPAAIHGRGGSRALQGGRGTQLP